MKGFVSTLLATAAFGMIVSGAAAQNTAATTGAGQNQQPKAGEQGPPKTVGAMQNEVGSKATNPEDVRRQTEGKPTMAEQAREGRSESATHPGMTEHAPGTVGAAPGTSNPSGEKARK